MQDYQPQPGDIAACWGGDWKSRFISGVTAWPLSPPGLIFGPSHVAIMSHLRSDHEVYWCESTTMTQTPCVVNQKQISGVQAHHVQQRISEYKQGGGSVVIYRVGLLAGLDEIEKHDLTSLLAIMIASELKYDLGAALLSGARISARILSMFGVKDDDVFCSDLVATALKEIDLLDRHVPSSLYTPASLLREIVRSGTYERLVTI